MSALFVRPAGPVSSILVPGASGCPSAPPRKTAHARLVPAVSEHVVTSNPISAVKWMYPPGRPDTWRIDDSVKARTAGPPRTNGARRAPRPPRNLFPPPACAGAGEPRARRPGTALPAPRLRGSRGSADLGSCFFANPYFFERMRTRKVDRPTVPGYKAEQPSPERRRGPRTRRPSSFTRKPDPRPSP